MCKVWQEGSVKDTQLYEQLLGLSKPWTVGKVQIELELNRITVLVECEADTYWVDPETNQDRAHIHSWIDRQWRHLNTCQLQTYIEARVPRLKLKSGRVEEVQVPWADRFSRITRQMEVFVIELMKVARSVKQVAELLELDWHTINGVIKRGVERGMSRRQHEPVRYVGLDEKCIGKGHRYASVLSDIGGSRVLDLVPGHKLEDAETLLKTLSQEQRQGVQAAAMDMWAAYMSASGSLLPNADVVHDRFHVSKLLNDALDQVRRAEHKQLLAQGDSTLSRTKYQWLRRWSDKRCAQAVEFRKLYQAELKTSRAWALKESFVGFWQYRCERSARRFFTEWTARAMRSRLRPMKRVAQTLRKFRAGILNYTRHRITNAAAEGFNSMLQAISSNARGFRNFSNYRNRVLFFCGGLDLLPASA
jgi:transposase